MIVVRSCFFIIIYKVHRDTATTVSIVLRINDSHPSAILIIEIGMVTRMVIPIGIITSKRYFRRGKARSFLE